MEKVLLEHIFRHMKEETSTDLREGRSHLTYLVGFCDKTNGFVVEARAVDVICTDFSKAFGAFSCSILVPSFGHYGLDGWANQVGESLVGWPGSKGHDYWSEPTGPHGTSGVSQVYPGICPV